MNASRNSYLSQPYVMTPDELTKLCQGIADFAPEIEFDVKCKDSVKRSFSLLTELLEFENPTKKDINVLSIQARSKNSDTKVWLKFDKDSSSNILISIDGNEEATSAISDLVEDRLSAMKPWYSFVAKTDFTLILLVSLLALILGMSLAIVLGMVGGADRPPSPITIRESITGQMFAVASIIAPFIFGYFLNRGRAAVFPMGVIALGQGAKRHSDKELVRTLVVVGFFVSLASSIVAALILML